MRLETFLKDHFKHDVKIFFAKVWGSRSHNTAKEDSDYDFTGVYLIPTSKMVSLNPGPDTIERDGDPDKILNPDYQFFEIGHFSKLLLKGNPGILEMLFTDRMMVSSARWDVLYEHRHKFLSQQAVKAYVGYMNGQLKRLESGQKLHTGNGGAYNEKFAYHIIRLGVDAKRIASGQEPIVWKEGSEREGLMDIRNGKYSWITVKSVIESLLSDIESLKPWKIPETGDKEFLNQWLIDTRWVYW